MRVVPYSAAAVERRLVTENFDDTLHRLSLVPTTFSAREKLILAGLFLAKFDRRGVEYLGFGAFSEAFNVLGFALGGKPASVKNYRDEFDPHFPNARTGWDGRELRDHCARVLHDHGHLDLVEFAGLLEHLADCRFTKVDDEMSPYARRTATGAAAEGYFTSVFSRLPEFRGFRLEDTTRLGCGYDFKLVPDGGRPHAVEVKGLVGRSGRISLTEKEYRVAGDFDERYHLFIVRNLLEQPFHEIHPNPLKGSLSFERSERVIVQVAWDAKI